MGAAFLPNDILPFSWPSHPLFSYLSQGHGREADRGEEAKWNLWHISYSSSWVCIYIRVAFIDFNATSICTCSCRKNLMPQTKGSILVLV